MYVITEFTEAGSFKRADAYSAGSKYAIELPIATLTGHEVYVFKGDVQDMANSKTRKPAYVRFEGDVSALLSTISAWRKELPDVRDAEMFICEARLMEALSPKLNPICHGCPEPTSADDDETLSLLNELILEEED